MGIAIGSIHARPVILSGESTSTVMLVPRNCSTATFFTPRKLSLPLYKIAGVERAAWALQSAPVYTDATVEEWYDIYAFDPGRGDDNEPVPLLFPFSANQALVVPVVTLGAGFIRISTLGMPQTEDVTWTVFFSGFYN